jgi:hypothetical protein
MRYIPAVTAFTLALAVTAGCDDGRQERIEETAAPGMEAGPDDSPPPAPGDWDTLQPPVPPAPGVETPPDADDPPQPNGA